MKHIADNAESENALRITGVDFQAISKIDRETFPIDLFKLLGANNISFTDQDEQNDYFIFYSYLANDFRNLTKDTSIETINRLLERFMVVSKKILKSLENDNSDAGNIIKQVLRNKVDVAPTLVDYFFASMQGKSPTQSAIRDSIMAENVVWLKEKIYPNDKIIVWSANLHNARNINKSMGDYLFKKYGDDIYAVALVANEGEWQTIGVKDSYPILKAKQGSFENLFHLTGYTDFFLDLRKLKNTKDGKWLSEEKIMRPHGYVEQRKKWTDVYDAVIFNDTMTRSHVFEESKN